MVPAPASALTDPERISAVRASGLLDTEPEESFDRFARLASIVLDVPFSFVTVVDEARSFWKAAVGPDLRVRQNPVDQSFCQFVIATGQPLIVDDTIVDRRTSSLSAVTSLGIRSWAGFPLRDGSGAVIGSLGVGGREPRRWDERDLTVLATLSEAVNGEIALRNWVSRFEMQAADLAREAERSAELARTLQETLLPPSLLEVPGCEVAALYLPAGRGEVTGDFYDVFPTGSDSWGVVLGDVSGKGLKAAKVAAWARYTVRASAIHTQAPDSILKELNSTLFAYRPHGDEGFVTAVYAAVSREGGGLRVHLAGAGHGPVLVLRSSGELQAVMARGQLLGVFEELMVLTVELDLGPGDLLLVHSDGVTEARVGPELFGEQRLAEVVRGCVGCTARQTAERVIEAVESFAPGERSDDLTVLALRAGVA